MRLALLISSRQLPCSFRSCRDRPDSSLTVLPPPEPVAPSLVPRAAASTSPGFLLVHRCSRPHGA